MGYFDGLADGSFKRTDDGRIIFYPWGILGSGYEIPTDESYREIRQYVKRYLIVSLPLVIALFIFAGWLFAFVALPILFLAYLFKIRNLTREFTKASEKLSLKESYQLQAASHNLGVLWALEIGSIILVLLGIGILFVSREAHFVAIVSILFFGLCSLAIGFMIRVKLTK